ncbi:hypothetical protein G5V59_08450 [Nocardioides sp. W3-2-3]|uniref:hypothetical protein n=1 Tax=Nocardioides convexus TaxID=2712224 RepID=UPI003100FE09|nr:hypothetical protein [Nocardioides convexus]
MGLFNEPGPGGLADRADRAAGQPRHVGDPDCSSTPRSTRPTTPPPPTSLASAVGTSGDPAGAVTEFDVYAMRRRVSLKRSP